MTEPTNDEIDALVAAYLGDCGPQATRVYSFAHAVLAKWATPPAAVREPAAYLHDDGYWTATKTDTGRKLNDRLLFAGSPKVAVYTTPQPTKAQAVAVPLTDEQIVGVMHSIPINAAPSYHIAFARAIEQAHGIKGGQHGADN